MGNDGTHLSSNHIVSSCKSASLWLFAIDFGVAVSGARTSQTSNGCSESNRRPALRSVLSPTHTAVAPHCLHRMEQSAGHAYMHVCTRLPSLPFCCLAALSQSQLLASTHLQPSPAARHDTVDAHGCTSTPSGGCAPLHPRRAQRCPWGICSQRIAVLGLAVLRLPARCDTAWEWTVRRPQRPQQRTRTTPMRTHSCSISKVRDRKPVRVRSSSLTSDAYACAVVGCL